MQFSKDMDESTFAGHVLLRYTGPVLPGDRAFDGLKLTYDRGRRALTVDPGDVLRPRRQVELILLPGHLRHRRPHPRPARRRRPRPTSSTCCAIASGAERAGSAVFFSTTISGSRNSAGGRRHPDCRKRATTS